MNDKVTDKRPAFFMVEDAVIEKFDLTPYEGWVYITILKYANRKTGEAFPGIATLAQVAQMSKSQVMRSIAALEKKNLIKVVRDDKPLEGEKRKREVNHYFVLSASNSVSQEVGVVSDRKYPSVSQEVGVVSGSDKNQSGTEPELINKEPRKRSPLKIKFPSNIKSYTEKHIEAYQQQHTTEMTALIKAWHGEMYISITEVSKLDARAYIEVHQELARLHKPCEDYPALAKYTRNKEAWKVEKGGKVLVADMLKYVTDYKPAPKKILYDDPTMDLSKPMPNILSKFQQDELERKARENG